LEGPKTLKRLHGSSSSSAPVPTIVPSSPAAATPAAPPKPVSLKPLARFAAKDPFVPQVVSAPSKPTPVLANDPPAVRASHWVEKDPFVQQLSPPCRSARAAQMRSTRLQPPAPMVYRA
jgi:hypothetical protein